jgi:hypothetical protein
MGMREKTGRGPPAGGGSRKGRPNKSTAIARRAFSLAFEQLAPEAEGWIRKVAQEDPAKATDLFLRLAEYHVPKLAQQQVTGEDGGPVQITIRTLAKEE